MDTKLLRAVALLLLIAAPCGAIERSTINAAGEHTTYGTAVAGGDVAGWAQDESVRFEFSNMLNLASATVYPFLIETMPGDTYNIWNSEQGWVDAPNNKVTVDAGVYKIILLTAAQMDQPNEYYYKYLRLGTYLNGVQSGMADYSSRDEFYHADEVGRDSGFSFTMMKLFEVTNTTDITWDMLGSHIQAGANDNWSRDYISVEKLADSTRTNLTSRRQLGGRTLADKTWYQVEYRTNGVFGDVWDPHNRIDTVAETISFERTGIFEISIMMDQYVQPDRNQGGAGGAYEPLYFFEANLVYGAITNTFGMGREATYDSITLNEDNYDQTSKPQHAHFQLRITNTTAVLFFRHYSDDLDPWSLYQGGYCNIIFVGDL
jgi:hypothetical protein